MTTHKIYTEKVNGGVIAECKDDSCTWSGSYTFAARDCVTGQTVEKKDQVFPNRPLAVEAHKAFHSAVAA
jgi:hypothetical protein